MSFDSSIAELMENASSTRIRIRNTRNLLDYLVVHRMNNREVMAICLKTGSTVQFYSYVKEYFLLSTMNEVEHMKTMPAQKILEMIMSNDEARL